jgi:hypothetical protein
VVVVGEGLAEPVVLALHGWGRHFDCLDPVKWIGNVVYRTAEAERLSGFVSLIVYTQTMKVCGTERERMSAYISTLRFLIGGNHGVKKAHTLISSAVRVCSHVIQTDTGMASNH